MTRRPAERVGKGSWGRRRSGAERRASGLIVQDPPDALQVLGGPAPPVPLTFGANDSSWGKVHLGCEGDDAAGFDGLDLKPRPCRHGRRRGHDTRRRAAFRLEVDHLDDGGVALRIDEALLFSDAVRGPGTLKPRAVVEESKGAHSTGWMSAHTVPGAWRSLAASWNLTVCPSFGSLGPEVPRAPSACAATAPRVVPRLPDRQTGLGALSGPFRATEGSSSLRYDCMEHEPGATRRDAPVVSPQIEGRQRSPENVRKGDGHECCQDQCDHRARGPARELRGAVPEPGRRSREDSRLRAVRTAAPAGGHRSVPGVHPLGERGSLPGVAQQPGLQPCSPWRRVPSPRGQPFPAVVLLRFPRDRGGISYKG